MEIISDETLLNLSWILTLFYNLQIVLISLRGGGAILTLPVLVGGFNPVRSAYVAIFRPSNNYSRNYLKFLREHVWYDVLVS